MKERGENCWLIKTIDAGCIAGRENVSSSFDCVCHMEKNQKKKKTSYSVLTTPATKEHLHY